MIISHRVLLCLSILLVPTDSSHNYNRGNLQIQIFQENKINVVHIESRKSRRNDAEYDIYVDVETDNIRLEELVNR